MTRLIFSGVLEKYPNLKFITHHCGGMAPFFEQRITIAYDMNEKRLKSRVKQGLTKPVIDYYRMFFADTAVHSKSANKMRLRVLWSGTYSVRDGYALR